MIQHEERTCPRCQTEYRAIKAPISGKWLPAGCPSCRPAPVEPQETNGKRVPAPDTVLQRLSDSGVNVHKYKGACLTNSAVDWSGDPHVPAALKAYLAMWAETGKESYPTRDWLYLYGADSVRDGRTLKLGKLGNGKTMSAIAIARALIESDQLDSRRFGFRTAETLLLECEATFRAQSEDSEIRMLRRYEQLDLLIVDEVGVRAEPSPHAIRVFDELAKRREGKATIWTSNLSIAVLAELSDGMRRIASRMLGECGEGAGYIVAFHGPDRRNIRSRRPS